VAVAERQMLRLSLVPPPAIRELRAVGRRPTPPPRLGWTCCIF